MLKERPILFSTDMVQAIMNGRKTQTRRKCKHQYWSHSELVNTNENQILVGQYSNVNCPYGQPGDLLWVRETFTKVNVPDEYGDYPLYLFKANPDHQSMRWKPSIHMPKAAARIWLRVKEVRVERLHDITEEDAKAEGVNESWSSLFQECRYWDYLNPEDCYRSAKSSFESLWLKINGPDSWQKNPWVWVVEFEVLSTTGKEATNG